MSNDIELLQQLISIGDGSISHIYAGLCPDSLEGEGVRDSECPACQILVRAALAAPQQEAAADELASMTRMFHDACADLGLINEALGLDPNAGGAEPILSAIEELRSATPVAAEPPARDTKIQAHPTPEGYPIEGVFDAPAVPEFNTHDAAIIKDIEVMAADANNGFWPQALANAALRLIHRKSPAPPAAPVLSDEEKEQLRIAIGNLENYGASHNARAMRALLAKVGT